MLALYYVGLLADKTGSTIKGQSFWTYRTTEKMNVGLKDSLNFLWDKYLTNGFTSSQAIDYKNLGDLFYEYDRIPAFGASGLNLNLRARGD